MRRASYPIALKKLPSYLCDLSELEKALISTVLPMIFIYQHRKSGGKFKSFGKSVALQNDLDVIAKVLPCTPEDVCYGFKQRGIWKNVRPLILRRALDFFNSTGFPTFADIEISEANHKHISAVVENDKHSDYQSDTENSAGGNEEETSEEKEKLEDFTPPQRLLKKGRNQFVENETALACESVPMGAKPLKYVKVLRDATLEIISKRILLSYNYKKLYHSHVTESWELKFPLPLPNGRGGSNDCTYPSRKLNLEDWIKYVIQIEEIDFSRNIIFIPFAIACYNNVVRRRKITGFACNKTISASARDAVKELTELVHEGSNSGIPLFSIIMKIIISRLCNLF